MGGESTLVGLESDGEGATTMRGSSVSCDSDAEEWRVKDTHTSKCTSESASHERDRRDGDAQEEGKQAVNEEVGNSPHVLAEKAIDQEVSKNAENADEDDQDEDVEIDPYIPINHDQSGEAPEDSDQGAQPGFPFESEP